MTLPALRFSWKQLVHLIDTNDDVFKMPTLVLNTAIIYCCQYFLATFQIDTTEALVTPTKAAAAEAGKRNKRDTLQAQATSEG